MCPLGIGRLVGETRRWHQLLGTHRPGMRGFGQLRQVLECTRGLNRVAPRPHGHAITSRGRVAHRAALVEHCDDRELLHPQPALLGHQRRTPRLEPLSRVAAQLVQPVTVIEHVFDYRGLAPKGARRIFRIFRRALRSATPGGTVLCANQNASPWTVAES